MAARILNMPTLDHERLQVLRRISDAMGIHVKKLTPEPITALRETIDPMATVSRLTVKLDQLAGVEPAA